MLQRFLQVYRSPSSRLLPVRKWYRTRHRKPLAWDARGKGFSRLVIIVAGYKESLWNIVLERIARARPENTDICVVCPGKFHAELSARCAAKGWSFLAIRENQLALAQNLAIELHPRAQVIHKLDEDIVVGEGYFDSIEDTYAFVEAENEHQIGFVAPTLNVNGFSYRLFLKFIDKNLLPEFRRRFGDCRSSCVETAAWRDPRAAEFLWDHSLPFDNMADCFRKRERGYVLCHHRFSIGAICFARSLWEQMGGFSRAADGYLGVEEADFCAFCCDSARAMIVSDRTFAGHIGFGPQTKDMLKWVITHAQDLR